LDWSESQLYLRETAFFLKLSADGGNAEAQYDYGIRVYNGVSANYAEAAGYFKRSADQGHAVSQINYGICLHDGVGVSVNYVEAARYFKLPADHDGGCGVETDPTKSRRGEVSEQKEGGAAPATSEEGKQSFGRVHICSHV
jgi:hypothetical protein